MTAPDRSRLIETLVAWALEHGVEGLEGSWPEDPTLRGEVLARLGQQRAPVSRALPVFGPYRCEALLGVGGMGTVYLAHRVDGQFSQRVAIKMLGAHLAGSGALEERLREERQILAGLNHPNITRLLDGGATPEGAVYMVMEYVEGRSFLDYCNARNLDLRSRLGLFREICGAVAYAHRNLVVHRDLKPSNILVTSEGQPKLLDFGIAKLVETGGEATATQAIGTPRYASPEQLRNRAVTTASDSYSLGVILYELVAGRWPFGNANSVQDTWRRLTTDVEPAPLGIPGLEDLAVILNKALANRPEDRYRSVDDFSEDVRRFLFGEPVLARAQTIWYRGVRFVGRYKAGVATAGLAVASLLGATVISLRQAGVAEREAERARGLAKFTTEMMLAATPVNGKDPTVLDLLGGAADRVGRSFANDAASEAEMRGTLGRVYAKLGVRDKARAQLQLALAKAQTPMVRGRILQELGTLSAAQGDRTAGRKLLEEALALIPGDFQIRMDLGNLLGTQGESVYRQAAASVPPSDLRWAIAMTQVGRLRLEAGDLAQASTILADATASLRLAPGPPPEVVPALIAFARLKRIQRNPTGAAILIEEAIRVGGLTPALERESRYLRVLEGRGEEVVEAATSSGQAFVAGLAWTRLGKPIQGEPLLRVAVNEAKGTIERAEALAALAQCLEQLGRTPEATAVRRQAIAVYEQGFGAYAASYPALTELRAAR